MLPTLPQHYAVAWKKAEAFHGHACPGLAIGCRIAVDALALLAHAPSADEELVCIAETDSCALDAIQALTGCSMGKGNLLLRLRGKTAFSFFVRGSGCAARFLWHGRLPGLAREGAIYRYLTSPAEELYTVARPGYPVPPKAAIYTSLACSVCGEQAAEPYIRLQEGRNVCLDCFEPRLRATL